MACSLCRRPPSSTSFIKGENPEDLYTLYRNLHGELKPATHMEQILVEKMIHNQWLSIRAIRLQSELLVTREPWQDIPKDLGLLIRYQTAADRAFHKAHAELLKLQKERKKSEIGSVSKNPGQAPDPPAEETKESQDSNLVTATGPMTEAEMGPRIEPYNEKLNQAA